MGLEFAVGTKFKPVLGIKTELSLLALGVPCIFAVAFIVKYKMAK